MNNSELTILDKARNNAAAKAYYADQYAADHPGDADAVAKSEAADGEYHTAYDRYIAAWKAAKESV